jgi:O-antigen ligase
MNSSSETLSGTVPVKSPGLGLYLLFIVSWFLHLPARFEVLGTVRIDLLLVALLIGVALVMRTTPIRGSAPDVGRVLRVLIVYAILTIPFVEWPGSVIKFGLPNFIKAVVFFYFTVAFVRTKADLQKFMVVFLAVQSLRILEPLYLNLTQDYWGSQATMRNWESMHRLSGAPSDVINPNGLAFVICTVIPFLYYMAGVSWKWRLAAMALVPVAIYALALTGSRSGIIGLLIVVLGIAMKTRKLASFALAAIIGFGILGTGFMFLSPELQDRYLSIIGKGEKNIQTAEDRLAGMTAQLEVAMRRPIVGHGLGTSAEANANFTISGPYAGWEMPAHNLYLEVGQELGIIGVIIFLFFIKAIFSAFWRSRRLIGDRESGGFLSRVTDAMQVWLAMNVVFSFASYGLSSYEWYLFAGLSVVLQRLAQVDAPAGARNPEDVRRRGWSVSA